MSRIYDLSVKPQPVRSGSIKEFLDKLKRSSFIDFEAEMIHAH